jgi:N-acetyl-anhydromuramyl-L-alanine amidase AmpD
VITLLQIRPYTGDVVAPSPNHGARKAQAIEGIVLHATKDAGNEARSVSWLRSPKSRASCHLLVGRNGRVTRLVGDQQRAWHAGNSGWRGNRDVNSVTLGIEIANRNDGEPYTSAQYARVAEIVAHYCRQGLSLDDVVSHGEIAPGRKSDPFGWDWGRFRAMVEQQLREDVSPASAVPARASRSAGRTSDRRTVAPALQRVAAVPAPKSALRSRILWLNGLTVLAAAGAIVSETFELTFGLGVTVPQEVTTWALFGVGVVNIVLRFATTRPLGRSQNVHPSLG